MRYVHVMLVKIGISVKIRFFANLFDRLVIKKDVSYLMKSFSLFMLCLLLVISCNNKQVTTQSTAISGDSNGTTQITSTANQEGLAGKTSIYPTNGEITSSSSEITHPVFDIKDFGKFRFDETSQIFSFDVQSAVSIIEVGN